MAQCVYEVYNMSERVSDYIQEVEWASNDLQLLQNRAKSRLFIYIHVILLHMCLCVFNLSVPLRVCRRLSEVSLSGSFDTQRCFSLFAEHSSSIVLHAKSMPAFVHKLCNVFFFVCHCI